MRRRGRRVEDGKERSLHWKKRCIKKKRSGFPLGPSFGVGNVLLDCGVYLERKGSVARNRSGQPRGTAIADPRSLLTAGSFEGRKVLSIPVAVASGQCSAQSIITGRARDRGWSWERYGYTGGITRGEKQSPLNRPKDATGEYCGV